MSLDINTKKAKKNAYRISKERGIGASRIRVPGGYLKAEILGMVQKIAETYGNGIVHLTTRQGFEIEGIRLEDMDAINEMLQPIIELLDINQTEKGGGYPASGTRNVSACIGNNVLLPITIRQNSPSGLKKKFFPMTSILKSPSPAVPMIAPKSVSTISESSA